MNKFPHYQLLVFSKTPRAGTVKTRLQPDFPPDFSLKLHCQLVDYVLSSWTHSRLMPLEFWLAGDPALFRHHLPRWKDLPLKNQQGNDLGDRMHYAAEQAFASAGGVFLVGTDCPFVDSGYLQKACEALADHDVVVGPAEDGGYVLLGFKELHSGLFQDMQWGMSSVCTDTIKKIEQLELSYQCLSPLPDIDRPEDIKCLESIPEFSNFFGN